jgi:tetratricopeptide (TPR) repeat protein
MRPRTLPIAIALCLTAASAGAQGLAPKRELLGGAASVCASTPPPAPSAPAPTAAVDSLLTAGSRAAILGDQATARTIFQRAAQLDPQNPVVAYRLARTEEELGQGEAAAAEYCRYLALAPGAPNAAEVRERVEILAPPTPSPLSAEGTTYLRAGLEEYDRRDWERAAYSFTVVLRGCPDCASVWFDRGLAYAASRRNADAVRDFRKYLELVPDAADGKPVLAYVESLRRAAGPLASSPRAAPVGVLIQGLALPGLGQLTTGRPVLGVAVLGSVAAAIYYGTRPHTVVRTVRAEDPFGNPYEYQRSSVERTHLALGLGIAVSVSLASAIEAYLHVAGSGR